MSYGVIALDLDGTLLTPDKTILPQSVEALSQAIKSGIKVVIATGRHHCAVQPFYQELALDTPVVCCNGTYLYDFNRKKVLNSDPLHKDQAIDILNILDSYAMHGLMYADDRMCYEFPNERVSRILDWAKSLPKTQRPVVDSVNNLKETVYTTHSIWKFALSDKDISKLKQLSNSIREATQLTCEWSWHDQIDVTQTGNSKGRRLEEWVKSVGLTMEDVVAFGDNQNDLSMLESVGLGVSMGNADYSIKSRADRIIGYNTEPSIADFIYQEIL
jgi:hypothetical protein